MSDYIKTMRALVGKIPILQSAASVIIVNEQNEILLQLRKDNKCWAYAGGSVELDEVVENAAKRELFEETGLIANELELFGVFSGKEYHYIYPNGDEVSNIDHVYICREYSGELKPQESEVLDLKFFAIDNIPENLSPPVKKIIEKYVEENIKRV